MPERLAEGPDFVLHAVLDFIVDGYAPLLDKLEDVVGEMEDHAVARFPDQARIRRIFRLRRELRRFEDIAGRMEEVAAKLAEVEQPAIDKRARPYFRDVLDNTRRAVDAGALAQRHARLDARGRRAARAEPAGRDHPPARGLGGDPRGADRDRRDLRDELRRTCPS